MKKRLILGAVVVVLVTVFVWVWEPSLATIAKPSVDSFDTAAIERGEVLAGIGNCSACHTASAERPYAGGVEFPTPFGSLYSTNITPHPEQGIGGWSKEAFYRAMRQGVSRDGSHLFPAFPYTHFTRVTDEDLDALYAYMMTRQPVAFAPPDNELQAPFNLRVLQAGWKLLYFDDSPLPEVGDRNAQWNRGAYLAEGLAHCSVCHTPRNAAGAEIADAAYDGALVDNWYAPALNAQQSVPVPWTENLLFDYLRSGQSPYHGVAVGSMADVVHQGLQVAPDEDIHALATYFASKTATMLNDAESVAAERIRKAQQPTEGERSRGELLYVAACASCHYNSPEKPAALRAPLSLNSSLTADDPTNFLRVTLQGVGADAGTPGVVMPGYAQAFTDDDIIRLADYLRRNHTDRAPWPNLAERLAELRELR